MEAATTPSSPAIRFDEDRGPDGGVSETGHSARCPGTQVHL